MSRLSASPDVLRSICKQKSMLRKEIATSQTLIAAHARSLVSPVARISRQGHSVSQFVARGMAIFEGVRIGLRVVRAAHSLFGHKKRK